MSIRYRPMRPSDVAECVQIIAEHPILGPRYGPSIKGLGTAWMQVLGSDAFLGLVCEDVLPGSIRTLGSYVCCFICDDFATTITTPPLSWIGPELVSRVLAGASPMLTNVQVREANSVNGLNLLIWPSTPRIEIEHLPELRFASQIAFFEAYRGYLLKRLNAQATAASELVMALNSGGWCFIDEHEGYVSSLKEPAGEVVLKPHILDVKREMVAKHVGSWVSQFFAYTKAIIGFARSEQRLLAAALGGGTDEELSEELAISISGVKKTWRLIYQRVDDNGLDLFRPRASENENGDRGREKKHKLLVYLRDHPEELRPVSMKLLRSVR